jgi:ATP-dependent Clp protease ATP-binding subunit ClpB
MKSIVVMQLERLKRMLADRNVALTLSDAAMGWLAEKGYDPAYGARPLKRVIQRELQNPLAVRLLDGRLHDGATLLIDSKADCLVIDGEPLNPQAATIRQAVEPGQGSGQGSGRLH